MFCTFAAVSGELSPEISADPPSLDCFVFGISTDLLKDNNAHYRPPSVGVLHSTRLSDTA